MHTGLEGKRVAILGLGKSGQAAAALLLGKASALYGWDDCPSKELEAFAARGLQLVEKPPFEAIDAIVVSPGLPPTHPFYRETLARNIPIVGEAELGLRVASPREVTAITGSNGKTTVTSLTHFLLQKAGFESAAMGNIGLPLAEAVRLGPAAKVVAELSSFQLETMTTRTLTSAAILNVTPNHLDRHTSFEEYLGAKYRIAWCIKPGGTLYLGEEVPESPIALPKDITIVRFGQRPPWTLCSLPPQLAGSYNYEVANWMAAAALAYSVGVPAEALSDLTGFSKPAHRLQYLGEKRDVHFYDDSKATSLDAVMKAVERLPGPIHLLAGGVHKGAPYTPWKKPFQGKVKKLFAFGQAREQMARELAPEIPSALHETLQQAFEGALREAKPGDTILLSPGCSSYDQFKNFEERGAIFQALVKRT